MITLKRRLSPNIILKVVVIGAPHPLTAGQQLVCEAVVGELEVALVVELHEGGGVGVELLEVDVVHLRLLRRVPTVLAHVHLRSPLFVFIVVGDTVDF